MNKRIKKLVAAVLVAGGLTMVSASAAGAAHTHQIGTWRTYRHIGTWR